MTRLKLVAVFAAVMALGGCSPVMSWAAKLTPTGFPQFVDTLCDPPDMLSVQIHVPRGSDLRDDTDPVIWKVEFAQPTQLREITVGQKPAGGEEKIAWQPPKGDQLLVMMAVQEGGGAPIVEFTLDQLKDGKVRYDDEYLTADEFAKKREQC